MKNSAHTGWVSTGVLGLLMLAVSLPAPVDLLAQENRRERRRDRVRIAPTAPMATMFNRGRLGIELRGRPSDTDTDGAEVRGVVEDGPADEAGIRGGDIITAINGQSLLAPLSDEDDEDRLDLDESIPSQRLMFLARELEPGEEVVVDYLRDGAPQTVAFEAEDVGAFGFSFFGPGDGASRYGPRSFEFEMPEMDLRMEELRDRLDDVRVRGLELGNGAWSWRSQGLSLMTLTPGLGRYFDADEGVLVTDVDEDSTLGLQAGDVVTSIDGRTVDSPGDIRRILRSYEDGESVTFQIMRDHAAREVLGTIE